MYSVNGKSFVSGDFKFYKAFLFGEIIRKTVAVG
jgi:hypothetical protein